MKEALIGDFSGGGGRYCYFMSFKTCDICLNSGVGRGLSRLSYTRGRRGQ